MIAGLNHITIAVKNLEKLFQFYKEVLGFKPLMKHSKGAYFLDPDGHKLEIHVGDWKTRIESFKKKSWNSSIELFDHAKLLSPSLNIRAAKESESAFLSGLAMRSKSYWPYPPDYLEKCISFLKVTPEDIRIWRCNFKDHPPIDLKSCKTNKGKAPTDNQLISARPKCPIALLCKPTQLAFAFDLKKIQ